MLYSMTGYGRAEKTIGDKIFLIEIKSLNGKQFDIRMLTPSILKPYEIDIRNLINEGLERGSVECFFNIKYNGATKPVMVNTELLKAYYTSIKDVVTNATNSLTEDEWKAFESLVKEAIENVNKHRLNEGAALEVELLKRVDNIELHEIEIKKLEPNRRIKIKENLQKLIAENVSIENYDANRLEQELIYYIEKIDITEEQVRLGNHINYFKETIKGKEKSKGKKLSFILQEFGREINTTGSKANDADIQKLVVLMKDELEKMKEQVLNVL
jgi:uncharacterized protein YicC (UPF0701 family)